MKKGILIDASGDVSWIGGLYYKKNFIYALTQNKDFYSNYRIIIVTTPDYKDFFNCFIDTAKLYVLKKNKFNKMNLYFLALKNNCYFWFPFYGKDYFNKLGRHEIFWIPDFQHCHYSDFFTKEEIEQRSANAYKIINQNKALVLSSADSRKDLEHFFGQSNNVCVVHFVSYIENEIRTLTEDLELSVLKKYGLSKYNYFCISNQFWQHKNHIVVLKAIKKICCDNPDNDYIFAFTGKMSDYRNPEYIEKLKLLFEDSEIKSHIKMLGFMERLEQLVIIKNAKAVIQPSLFEGWGTVLEDAKVLDQTVILSDIPVHREQMNEKCFLFNPNNVDDLVNVINKVNIMEKTQDIEKGIEDMRERAKQYSQPFLEFLNKL